MAIRLEEKTAQRLFRTTREKEQSLSPLPAEGAWSDPAHPGHVQVQAGPLPAPLVTQSPGWTLRKHGCKETPPPAPASLKLGLQMETVITVLQKLLLKVGKP